MNTYIVSRWWVDEVEVQANSEAEAKELAVDMPDNSVLDSVRVWKVRA